jgi:hypothetical protein
MAQRLEEVRLQLVQRRAHPAASLALGFRGVFPGAGSPDRHRMQLLMMQLIVPR